MFLNNSTGNLELEVSAPLQLNSSYGSLRNLISPNNHHEDIIHPYMYPLVSCFTRPIKYHDTVCRKY